MQSSSDSESRDWVTKLAIRAHRYRNLIKRRKGVLLLVISAAVFYQACMLFMQPVRYSSTGQLVISERLSTPDGSSSFVDQDQNFISTELNIVQSPEVWQRAKQRLALSETNVSDKVEVTAAILPRTSIVEVDGVGQNPEYTQKFVQAAMQEYIDFKKEKRQTKTNSTLEALRDQLESLRKDRDDKQAQLDKFIKQNNMAFWNDQSKNAAATLSELKNRQTSLQTELRQLQTLSSEELLSRNAGTMLSNGPNNAGAPMSSDLSTQYLQKTQELIQRQAEYAERAKVWRPQHPRLVAMKEQIGDLNRLIDTIKLQNGESSKARIASIEANLTSVNESIKQWNDKSLEASAKDADYKRLSDSITTAGNLYEKVLLSIGSIDTGMKTDTGDMQILAPAVAAEKVPLGVTKHLLTGLALGFLVGFGILFLLDRADDRFSSPTEVMQQFQESVLGQIPNVEDTRSENERLQLLQAEDQRYAYAEAFRSLRSSLVFLPNQGELKMLLVTSAIPGEGKSTVTSNLASTMARAGARVLVVDADLRRGDLAELFGVDNKVGLSSVLRSELPWREAIKPTHVPTLSLLTCGPTTNQSGELLFQPILEKLLQEFRDNFDLVIFNTSPILATDDTPTLAPQFDGAIMVARADFTSARLVRNALSALYQRQVNVLGLVINCIDVTMPDYHYYKYPKYYTASA